MGDPPTLNESENPEEDICFVLHGMCVFIVTMIACTFLCFLATSRAHNISATFYSALNIWYHQKNKEKNMIVLSELIIQEH